MKKILFVICVFAISSLIILSCGSPKKEEPINKEQSQLNVEKKSDVKIEKEDTEEAVTETKLEEKEEEKVETKLGTPPQAEESKLEMKKELDNSKSPMKCQIVQLSKAVLSNSFSMMGKKIAKELVAKGKILVVVNQHGKIYFVYNQDGSFAGKKLAKYAANKFIGIIGKRKTINGVNIIIAEKIESMD